MFSSRLATLTPPSFLSGITLKLGTAATSLLSNAYSITSTMDQNLFLTRAMQWAGDVVFDAPTHALAQHLSRNTTKKIYRCVFDIRNPFPNHDMYAQAHHWVDVYFVFKTLQFRYPMQRLKDVSTKHAQLWIEFANGKSPWEEYKYISKGDEVVMVADEREGWVERSVKEHEELVGWGWERCEVLWESWGVGKGRTGFRPMEIEGLRGRGMT